MVHLVTCSLKSNTSQHQLNAKTRVRQETLISSLKPCEKSSLSVVKTRQKIVDMGILNIASSLKCSMHFLSSCNIRQFVPQQMR